MPLERPCSILDIQDLTTVELTLHLTIPLLVRVQSDCLIGYDYFDCR
jgi:hypothetical protein